MSSAAFQIKTQGRAGYDRHRPSDSAAGDDVVTDGGLFWRRRWQSAGKLSHDSTGLHLFSLTEPAPRHLLTAVAVRGRHHRLQAPSDRGVSRHRRHLGAGHHAVARPCRRGDRAADHGADGDRDERRAAPYAPALGLALGPFGRHADLRREDALPSRRGSTCSRSCRR